jgi:DNA (cytosine-5)-methyltransferase 1
MEVSYKWYMKDLDKVEKNGLKVFSCFACGGGSTMGYKLAGYEVIGANEIDPEMAWHYRTNHNPKHYYLEDIRTFKTRTDLPDELFHLDILDGSPPCSSFSISGHREKDWGKEKVFREGQAEQTLDDLFFDYIEVAKKLNPKIVIAENVRGMLVGNAKGYVKQVIKAFEDIGYDVQLFLLNAASMGIPQKRERVFFICRRKDLNLPPLHLKFNERLIPLKEALQGLDPNGYDRSNSENKKYYDKVQPGKPFSTVHPKKSLFNWIKLNPNDVSTTLAATSVANCIFHWEKMRLLSEEETCAIGSYPLDYKFSKKGMCHYMVGMSVPPLMTYRISDQIYKQWFQSKENK